MANDAPAGRRGEEAPSPDQWQSARPDGWRSARGAGHRPVTAVYGRRDAGTPPPLFDAGGRALDAPAAAAQPPRGSGTPLQQTQAGGGRGRRRCGGGGRRVGALTAVCAATTLSMLLPDAVLGGPCSVAPGGKGPTIRGIRAVMGIEGTVTDPAGNLQGTPVPGPHPITPTWSGQRQRVSAVVGSRIEFNISAAWGWEQGGGTGQGLGPSSPQNCEVGKDCITPWPKDLWRGLWYGNELYGNYNLSLYAYEDPGVPNGAVLTTQSCLGYPQQYWDRNTGPPNLKNPYGTVICNPVMRTFTWEPRKGQEGMVHSMCFTVLVKELPNDCQSDYRCIDIEVIAPEIQWDRTVTAADMQPFHSPVGCHFRQCFQAYDQTTLYPVEITEHATEHASSLPPGAILQSECEAMTASKEVYALFPSDTAAPFAVKQGPCKKCIDWVAVRGMETQIFTVCVQGTDRSQKPENSALRTAKTCIVVEVPKCKYCVQTGDTLHYINKRYNLNSNWLQLWNANGMEEIQPHPLSVATTYADPDSIHNGNSIINLGPIYEVQQGEDMVSVAKMLRTTVKKLLDINPDIKDPANVKAGSMVCVQPCTDIYFATTKV